MRQEVKHDHRRLWSLKRIGRELNTLLHSYKHAGNSDVSLDFNAAVIATDDSPYTFKTM